MVAPTKIAFKALGKVLLAISLTNVTIEAMKHTTFIVSALLLPFDDRAQGHRDDREATAPRSPRTRIYCPAFASPPAPCRWNACFAVTGSNRDLVLRPLRPRAGGNMCWPLLPRAVTGRRSVERRSFARGCIVAKRPDHRHGAGGAAELARGRIVAKRTDHRHGAGGAAEVCTWVCSGQTSRPPARGRWSGGGLRGWVVVAKRPDHRHGAGGAAEALHVGV